MARSPGNFLVSQKSAQPLGTGALEGVGAVGHHLRPHQHLQAVFEAVGLADAGIDQVVVDLLEVIAVLLQVHHRAAAELRQVPLDGAGLDHGLDLGEVGAGESFTLMPLSFSNGSKYAFCCVSCMVPPKVAMRSSPLPLSFSGIVGDVRQVPPARRVVTNGHRAAAPIARAVRRPSGCFAYLLPWVASDQYSSRLSRNCLWP